MRAVVTGGSGVVGRALVGKLAAAGDEPVVYDLRPPLDPSVSWTAGDVLDRSSLVEATRDCDVVFHLAARLPQARLSDADFREINVGGTRNVADVCLENGMRRLVFASTIEIYGPQEIAAPLGEDAPKLFTGTYSRTKWESEQLLTGYQQDHGLETVALRLPMVLGPGFYHEAAVLRMFHMLRRGLPIPVPTRDIPYSAVGAADCADAFVLAADRPGASGQVCNIAAPDTPSLATLVRDVAGLVGSRSVPLRVATPLVRAATAAAKGVSRLTRGRLPTTPAELMDFALVGGAYSIDRARRVLGFAPAMTCAEAWATTYRWYFQERISEVGRYEPER